jgi:hypothetical protein
MKIAELFFFVFIGCVMEIPKTKMCNAKRGVVVHAMVA